MIYGVVGAVFALVLTTLLHRNHLDYHEGDGFFVVLTSIFWLPWLVLVMLAWGWLKLDEVLTGDAP